jgi:catechol 2,3-dioxygenase-like lactoylglutathione lyase family enzyme
MMTQADFPTEGVELTHLLVVSDLARSRQLYRDVLGATVYREYGGTSCVLNFQGSWLLLVTGGRPTRDKPTVTFGPPADPDSEP